MNTLLNKFNSIEQFQKEMNKQLNIVEAESKILLLIIQEINRRGGIPCTRQ